MIDINEIAAMIRERNDDVLARAFTMQICGLLKENGIIPVATEYTKQGIDDITNASEYKLVCEYGVCFKELDTSEHDEQIRADERAKTTECFKLKIKECCAIAGTCDFEDLDIIAEQLKEQKGETK